MSVNILLPAHFHINFEIMLRSTNNSDLEENENIQDEVFKAPSFLTSKVREQRERPERIQKERPESEF